MTGEVLITGGSTSPTKYLAASAEVEIYDPQAQSDPRSSLLGQTMAQPRVWHGAIPLPDGRVLLAGGAVTAETNAYEVFDPTDGSFNTLATSPHGRYLPSTTLLPDGKILVAGGCSDGGCDKAILNTIEIFDPALDQPAISKSVSMTERRFSLGSALLPDGSVLLAGGTTTCCDSETRALTAEVWSEASVEEAFRPVVEPIRTTNPTGLASVTAGTTVTLHGRGFTGVSEGSSGQSPSPTDHPVVMWMPLNGVPTTGTTVEWTDTTLEWKVPPTSYPGPGYLFVAVNGVRSKWRLVTVLPAANGDPCEYGSQCESGYCAAGMCCDQPCDGTCMSCRGAETMQGVDGACSPVRPGIQWSECEANDVDECDTTGECDGAGHCAVYPEGTRCDVGWICMAGRCTPGCNVHGDCGPGWVCLADGTCAPMFEDAEPGCAPACTVGKRRRGVSEFLVLLLLGGLWRARRRRAVA